MFVRASGSSCEVQTPAKLNLFLEVLGRRADGYHELETLMATVSIYDSLVCELEPSGQVQVTCQWSAGLRGEARRSAAAGETTVWDALPVERDNLAGRAVVALRERAGVEQGLRLRLTKRIPAAAGLGGASSDAAAALVAANEVWKLGWTRDRLAEVAASLGSDIPFFLAVGGGAAGVAVCRGRGELVEVQSGFPALAFVAVRPPGGLSTAEVYRAYRPAGVVRRVERLLAAARRGDLVDVARNLHNALQRPAAELSPWIARLQLELGRLDLLGHGMSGSGSTCFGICRHVDHARRMAQRLRSLNLGAVFWGVTGR